MVKYIKALMGGTLTFIVLFSFLSNLKVFPSKIVVELEGEILENDIFYVYYLQEGVKKWSDEFSVYQRVKGNAHPQKLKFALPLDKPIDKIRIDIGANKKQQPMIIRSLTLKSEVGSYTFDNDLIENFDLNIYASYDKGKFVPKIVSERYDPFLVSKSDVFGMLEKLRTPSNSINSTSLWLVTGIFSLAIFVFLIYVDPSFHVDYAYILSFVIIIVAPFFVQVFVDESKNKSLEKRELAAMPGFTSFETFPTEFENYFNDNFGLRNEMIEWSGKIKVNIFKTSPKPEKVQFGDSKFLFYNSLEDEIFSSYTHTNLLSQEELEKLYQKFANRRKYLNDNGIIYLSGFWPNKHTIYPEYLPATMSLQIEGNISLADQMTDYFKKKEFPFFDVREDMIRAKGNRNLYRKLDTHWNANGAYTAYNSFCLSTYGTLGLEPYSLSDFEIVEKKEREGDLTEQIGVSSILGYVDDLPIYRLKNKSKTYEVVSNKGYPAGTVITFNKNCGNDKKILIFRDSYTTALIQFISLHFKEAIYISEVYDEALVDKLKPNIVISCRVERYMLSM